MSATLTPTSDTAAPKVIYLKDYQAPNYFIDEIHLEFDLNDDFTTVKSTLHLRENRHNSNNDKRLILNGEELILLSIKMNGALLPMSHYTQTKEHLIIANVPESFDLEIITRLQPDKNTALCGLYRSGTTYCTQCEPEGFRRITFFADHPDILSRYTTTIIADKVRYPVLLSNGNLIASGEKSNGRHFATWEDPFKKPSYLFALVAGSFDLLEDHFVTASGRDVLLRVYTDHGFGDAADHAMYSLKQAMSWDEKAYGREYDLDIYMIVAISDFNMGAMENKGLNIFNTKYVLAKRKTATDYDYIHILSVIGHEYFHNWSGNRVTCRDWFQLSLKEGLTIFRDQSFSADTFSHAVMRIHDVNRLREVQFAEDSGPLAHPVRPDSFIEINNFYTATIYEKGSEVLRMLQTILGIAQFRKGMDLYFAKFDGQAITIDDFVAVMQDISGINLQQFRLWYSQAGTPEVKVSGQYDAENKTYTLTLSQHTPPTPGQNDKQALFIPIRIGLLDQSGNAIPLQLPQKEIQEETVLFLQETEQRFVFFDVKEQPIPSLLRHFSAPVKLNFSYTDQELNFLWQNDKDEFNRWEAGQKYMMQSILKLVALHAQGAAFVMPEGFIENFKFILNQKQQDEFLLSEMLVLPSEKYISEQMPVINVEGIHWAREFLLMEIATHLAQDFLHLYNAAEKKSLTHSFAIEQVGSRQLKNRCLSYLMLLPEYVDIGVRQFTAALQNNMTDTEAVLQAIVNIDLPQRQHMLDRFYDEFKQDPLVIDKWFSLQASSKLTNTLQEVQRLLIHPAFEIKNPNKVYSLIGTFGQRNAINFHAKGGAGYAFLGDVVAALDKLNPQVAGRMVNPLTSWRRYDKERQQLMRAQLERLSRDTNLSPDLYELVTKSLK